MKSQVSPLTEDEKAQLENLVGVIEEGKIGLIRSVWNGREVAVIVAEVSNDGRTRSLTPMAVLLKDSDFKDLTPPSELESTVVNRHLNGEVCSEGQPAGSPKTTEWISHNMISSVTDALSTAKDALHGMVPKPKKNKK